MVNSVAYVVEHRVSTEHLFHTSAKFFPVFLWFTERSRIKDVAKVLVQGFRDSVDVVLMECLTPFVNEFGLGGFEFYSVNHLSEASEGSPL
jgi:hypothetical protein